MRAIRAVALVPYDARELIEPKGYMYYDEDTFRAAVHTVSKSMDEYPLHFILHMIHCLEIIGYKHPEENVRREFLNAYIRLVRRFHMVPEEEDHMDARLTEDRIADGTVQG
jgi:fructose-1,6-bisphosphatase